MALLSIDELAAIRERCTHCHTFSDRCRLMRHADALAAEIKRLRAVLTDLVDLQNGPPLVRDAEEWEKVMDEANALLDTERTDE